MNYYESKDLGKFAGIGKFKPELAKKFSIITPRPRARTAR